MRVVLCMWSVCSSSQLVGGGVVVVVCLCRVHLSDALHSCAWSWRGFHAAAGAAGLCGSDLLHRRALGMVCYAVDGAAAGGRLGKHMMRRAPLGVRCTFL